MRRPRSGWTYVVVGLALGACRQPATERGLAPVAEPGPAERTVEVDTARARRDAIVPRIVVPGSLVARRQSEIGAEVTGRIVRVFVDVGDHVEGGEPLFQIDPSSYQAGVRQAQAGLELARAERRQMEADLARARHLHEKQVLAAQEIERLETQLAVARARERQAAAGLAVAREDLDKTRVVAPYAATVAERRADEGTSARTMPQTIVVVLQETGELEGRAGVPEGRHTHVRPGDPARLHVEGHEEPIATRVAAVADTIDPATRTFLVRMPVPNPDHRLKAGAFARIEIEPRASREALVVPRGAIRSEAGHTSVLAVRDGQAVEVPVQVGMVTDEDAEVLSGLEAGSVVILGDAARELAPGTRVRPRAERKPSA